MAALFVVVSEVDGRRGLAGMGEGTAPAGRGRRRHSGVAPIRCSDWSKASTEGRRPCVGRRAPHSRQQGLRWRRLEETGKGRHSEEFEGGLRPRRQWLAEALGLWQATGRPEGGGRAGRRGRSRQRNLARQWRQGLSEADLTWPR